MNCGTQTVNEAYAILGELIKQGKGDLPLIALHSSGDTSEVMFNKGVETVSNDESMGVLCDEEVGTEYASISV